MAAALHESLSSLVDMSPYLGILFLLIIGIWVIPFDEETALVMAGYLYYSGHSPLAVVLPIAAIGVFLGDYLAFWLGRRWTNAALRYVLPLVAGRQRSFSTLTIRLETYGSCVLLCARFLPGVRLPVHVLAGISGMPGLRYVRTSLLAVGTYVPAFFALAYSFGDQIERARSALTGFGETAWQAGLLLLGLWFFLRLRLVWQSRTNLSHPSSLRIRQ